MITVADPNNPLNLTTKYVWQRGDTFMLIAHKYRRPGQWTELLDLNKREVQRNNYIMREGDEIQIPEDWFPLPVPAYTTKFRGTHGIRQA